jgi:hypothetical protein
MFYRLGIRSMTLTHFRDNNWTDSSTDEPRHNGLTEFGKDKPLFLNLRIRREVKPTNGSWRTDETYIRIAGRWTYLYRGEFQPRFSECRPRSQPAQRSS